MAPFALHLAQKYSLGEKEVSVCKSLCDFYEIIHTEPMFLSSDKKTEIAKVGWDLAKSFAKLSIAAVLAKEKLWKCTPKLHLFVHLVEWDVAWGNPRFFLVLCR